MKEHPILFTNAMVRAILDGTKTQTRRVAREHKNGDLRSCPYGKPADQLWVKETHYRWGYWERLTPTEEDPRRWHFVGCDSDAYPPRFKRPDPQMAPKRTALGYHKRPSIFMPRWISRIQLEVLSVRAERLQEITEAGAVAEGVIERHEGTVLGPVFEPPQRLFRKLWDSINAARGFDWASDPWVWVVEFRRIAP